MRRVLVGAGLAGLMFVSMGQSSCSVDGGGGSGEPPSATAKIGETLSLTGTSYEVTSVETASEVGNQFTKEKANGEFIIVEIELTNEETEPSTIFSEAIVVIGGNGSEYTTSDDALFSVDDSLLLEEIQPGNSEKGTLIYDLPPDAVKGAYLRVEDLFSDATGAIDLGLGSNLNPEPAAAPAPAPAAPAPDEGAAPTGGCVSKYSGKPLDDCSLLQAVTPEEYEAQTP